MNRLPTAATTQSVLVLEDYNRAADKPAKSGIFGYVAFGLAVTASLVAGSVYWAATSTLDGAVVAPATLVVDGDRKSVEHLEGGIVRDIRVRDGDLVEAGQTLLELDSTDLDVNLDVLETQLADLMVRRARYLTQIAGDIVLEAAAVKDSFRVALPSDVWSVSYLTQKQIFDADAASKATEKRLQSQQLAGLEQQLNGLAAQRAANARQLDITREELGNLETLQAKGLVAAARVNARRVDIERLAGEDASLATQETQARNQMRELELAALTVESQRAQVATSELAQVEAQLATLVPQYSGALERRKRIAITAPVRGRVVDMRVLAKGGVVRPGVPILDIVPVDERLIVEARVNTADIEKLFVGQSTRVRLSAFEQGDVPEATGMIIGISADSLEDERTGQSYYTTRVELDDTQPEEVASLSLIPGMPADLFVNTGERTALSYLAQPLQDRIARTFIE